jgi:predicted nucleic acid-binding protein
MIAVFDSSPLIFLSRLNISEHALELFTDVIVPAHVREEILRKPDKASEKLQMLLNSDKVKVVQVMKQTRG